MVKLLARRLELLQQIQTHLMAAAKALRPGITERAMNHNAAFWDAFDKNAFAEQQKANRGGAHAAKGKHTP